MKTEFKNTKTMADISKENEKEAENITQKVIAEILNEEPKKVADICKKARVNVPLLNVRSKPDMTSIILGTLIGGTTIDVIKTLDNGFSEIKYKFNTAFVCTKYIKFM